jgi:hypothetical protein
MFACMQQREPDISNLVLSACCELEAVSRCCCFSSISCVTDLSLRAQEHSSALHIASREPLCTSVDVDPSRFHLCFCCDLHTIFCAATFTLHCTALHNRRDAAALQGGEKSLFVRLPSQPVADDRLRCSRWDW